MVYPDAHCSPALFSRVCLSQYSHGRAVCARGDVDNLIVAETISATSGLGYMATNAQEFMRMDTVLLAFLHFDLRLTGQALRYDRKSLERLFLGWRQGGLK